MATPKPKPKLTKEEVTQKILKDFGASISPKGVAAADAAAKNALEKKYPGMFSGNPITVRRTSGINRGN